MEFESIRKEVQYSFVEKQSYTNVKLAQWYEEAGQEIFNWSLKKYRKVSGD